MLFPALNLEQCPQHGSHSTKVYEKNGWIKYSIDSITSLSCKSLFFIPAATTQVRATIISLISHRHCLLAALITFTLTPLNHYLPSSLGSFNTANWLLSLVCLKFLNSSSSQCALQTFLQGFALMAEERADLEIPPEVAHHKHKASQVTWFILQILHSTLSLTNILNYSPLCKSNAPGRHRFFILWFAGLATPGYQKLEKCKSRSRSDKFI